MEIRYLRYFEAVAELKSFTRAAEKLHVAQPAISQQIRTLEAELDVRLLNRTKRSVALTAAGQAFLAEAKEIIRRADASLQVARRAAQGETGSISIGCFSTATSLFLPELLQTYRKRFPEVRVRIYEQSAQQQLEAFERGEIDLGFTRRLPNTHLSRFFQELVYRDQTIVVLPKDHPLATSARIELSALAEEDWVFYRRSDAPELIDNLTGLCVAAGFSPRLVSEAPMMQTVVMMVAAGVGVSIVPGCVCCFFNQPGLAFVPLKGKGLEIDLVVSRPLTPAPPTVQAFLSLLQKFGPTIRQRYERPKGTERRM